MPGKAYRNRVRIRVNGLLVENNRVLLAQIHSPVTDELIWTPPGGGLEFGETLEACLEREFLEETGLEVTVQDLRFVNELLKPPFHAIGFYFDATRRGGILKQGSDPEHGEANQLLKDVQWIDLDNLDPINLAPPELKLLLTGKSAGLKQMEVYSSLNKRD